MASAAFRMAPSHDFVAGAILLKHVSIFADVSLGIRIVSFRGSLAENARFGSLELQFLRMSRGICSFWKSGSSVFEEVSQEVWMFNFANAHRIFSFWKPGPSVFEDVSQKTLLFPLGAASKMLPRSQCFLWRTCASGMCM